MKVARLEQDEALAGPGRTGNAAVLHRAPGTFFWTGPKSWTSAMVSSAMKPTLCRWSAYWGPGVPDRPTAASKHLLRDSAPPAREGAENRVSFSVGSAFAILDAEGATIVAMVKSRSVIADAEPAGSVTLLMWIDLQHRRR